MGRVSAVYNFVFEIYAIIYIILSRDTSSCFQKMYETMKLRSRLILRSRKMNRCFEAQPTFLRRKIRKIFFALMSLHVGMQHDFLIPRHDFLSNLHTHSPHTHAHWMANTYRKSVNWWHTISVLSVFRSAEMILQSHAPSNLSNLLSFRKLSQVDSGVQSQFRTFRKSNKSNRRLSRPRNKLSS